MNAFLVKTGTAAWYFVDADKRVYAGKKAHGRIYAGELIGATYDRDKIPGGEFDHGEMFFSQAPVDLPNTPEKALEEMIGLHAYLVLKQDAGFRITDLVLSHEKKKPSGICKPS